MTWRAAASALGALALVALLSGGARADGGKPVAKGAAVAAATGLRVRRLSLPVDGIAYGPHRDGQHPHGPGPSRAQLAEDLALIAKHWRVVRIYGGSEFADTMLQVIRDRKLPLQVVLGVALGGDGDRAEIDAGVRLANAYPRIVRALIVGNETQVFWSAGKLPVERLLAAVREVRAHTRVPVTTSDDYNFWNKPESRPVAAELDFVMVHLHPLWNGAQPDSAVAWVNTQYEAIRAMHPDRAVVVGETGWATQRNDQGDQGKLMKGEVSEAAQARVVPALIAWARARRVPSFVFEVFDENWKGSNDPAEVEKHWGLYRADRSPKPVVQELR